MTSGCCLWRIQYSWGAFIEQFINASVYRLWLQKLFFLLLFLPIELLSYSMFRTLPYKINLDQQMQEWLFYNAFPPQLSRIAYYGVCHKYLSRRSLCWISCVCSGFLEQIQLRYKVSVLKLVLFSCKHCIPHELLHRGNLLCPQQSFVSEGRKKNGGDVWENDNL